MSKQEEATGEMSLIRQETATDVAETATTSSKEEAYTQKPASSSKKDAAHWASFGTLTGIEQAKTDRLKMLAAASWGAKAKIEQ